jgi:23S rRNA pseudouridine1911/1915/1917 synthase
MIHRVMQKNNQDTFIIPITYAHERLDQTLAKLMPIYSRTQIQDWIASGAVLVNNKTTKANYKVKGNENVSVEVILKPPIQCEPQKIPLDIIYEDEALILINKPVGLVVHPGAGNADRTLLNALLHHEPTLQMMPRAGILHRLDKNTSGLLVVAKTPAALRHLSQQLKKRTLLREYQAIVYGLLISGGTVNAPIDRHPLQRKRMTVSETGKNSVTYYRVAEKYRAHTRLKLRLETGRTHQIRVHMSHIHHPIVGDAAYGGRVKLTKGMTPELIQMMRHFKRQALHAFALGLTHPITEEFMRWEVDLPDDMQQLIKALREDLPRTKR